MKGGAGNGPLPATATAPPLSHRHRLWIIVFLSLFTCASVFTLISTARDPSIRSWHRQHSTTAAAATASSGDGIPGYVFDALIHYAARDNWTATMPSADMRAIAAVLRRRAPCNLLVFGLGAETQLWRALNSGGRTVFLDENQFYVGFMEEQHPGLEAYDVAYTTAVRDLRELLAAARRTRAGECRPAQDLLFSECRLALNDLPNELYTTPWDVILVDGPQGFMDSSPGRMSAIFTTAVLARSATGGAAATTDVLLHDYDREAEKVYGAEFLCEENLVAESSTPSLGHFAVPRAGGAPRDAFCAAAKPNEDAKREA